MTRYDPNKSVNKARHAQLRDVIHRNAFRPAQVLQSKIHFPRQALNKDPHPFPEETTRFGWGQWGLIDTLSGPMQ